LRWLDNNFIGRIEIYSPDILKDIEMSIKFTQFLRPDGRQKVVYIDLDSATEELAMKIVEEGYRFEVEELSTGQISMSISNDDEDAALRVCNNGPEVPLTIVKMITEFVI